MNQKGLVRPGEASVHVHYNKIQNPVLSRKIGNAEMILNFHSASKLCFMKQLDMVLSKEVYKSSMFLSSRTETYNFLLEQTVIIYEPHLVGKTKDYRFNNKYHSCTYLKTYAHVGIPTDRYNWFLREAEKAIGSTVYHYCLSESNGYTWIVCDIPQAYASCYVYMIGQDNLQYVGSLYNKMVTLGSDVVGVGHFEISVIFSKSYECEVLKFSLKKFQLTDKTEKKPIINESFVKKQPPNDVLEEVMKSVPT